ncbi:MAG: hypothetical protein H7X89_14580 [Rhizobiales bacterium]|nr:hypothetical protein [Hyphomicrobiales bacterium]
MHTAKRTGVERAKVRQRLRHRCVHQFVDFVTMKKLILIAVVVYTSNSALGVAITNCSKIRYFGSFSGYNLPFKLGNEFNETEALRKKAYMLACFDEKGVLKWYEKRLDGNMEFRHEFIYNSDGNLKTVKGSNSEGKITVHSYD